MKIGKRIIFLYFTLSSLLLISMILNSYTYNIEIENNVLIKERNKILDENSELFIEITASNSKEQIIKENPDLFVRDNIYYLDDSGGE